MSEVLYDKSGQRVEVPDEQVTQKLVSGELGTTKQAVNVQTSSGKVYTVPTQNLQKFAQAQPGLKVMSDADMDAHEAKKQQAWNEELYGGAANQAHVALMSGLSGLTLGGSDYLAGKVMSDEQKQALAHEKEANSVTSTGAGIAGALLPTLLSGGTAAPEEAALLGGNAIREASLGEKFLAGARDIITAPARGVEAGSGLAESGVKALIGADARTFAGQLAQRAITKAAGGAVTGGLSTGLMEIGENEVSPDHQLTGEQLFHDMTIGALLGGGVGAAGGLASATLERALAPSSGGGNSIRDMLRKQANEWEVESTGVKQKELRKMTRFLSEDEIGQWSHDNLAKFSEDGKHPITREAKLEAAQRAADDAAPKIEQSVEQLDAAGFKPDWGAITDRIRNEVVNPLLEHVDPTVKNVGKTLDELVTNSEAKLGDSPSFRDLLDLRRKVDEGINFNKADAAQISANAEKRSVRSIIENEIGTQGRAAAGEGWGQNYDAVKKQYQMGKTISDAIQSVDTRTAGHEPISLTSTILGAHGLGAFAAGHPMGLLAGASAMVGNHLLKTYGKAVGARMLNAIVESGGVQNTIMPLIAARSVAQAQRSYANAVTRGLAALTSGQVAANPVGRPKTLDGSFEEKSKMVLAMSANPVYGQELQQHASAMGPSFATVGSSYQLAGMKAMTFLATQVPKEKPIDPASPNAGTIKPSDAEKARFVRQFDAIEDPTNLLHAAGKGLLTRDMVDAVAATKPEMLKDLQSKVSAELKMLKAPLDPPQAAAVKMILGEPVFDRPIAPLAQPKVTTAGSGTPSKGHGHGQLKGSLSAAMTLNGQQVTTVR